MLWTQKATQKLGKHLGITCQRVFKSFFYEKTNQNKKTWKFHVL